GEMIGFRPGLNRRLFHFDEVPDVDVLAEVGAGTQPSERTDTRTLADMRALKMRERTDRRAIVDSDARAEHDGRFNGDVLSEFGVGRQMHRFWRDHRYAAFKRRHAQALLQNGFGFGKLYLRVDAAHVILRGFDRHSRQAHTAGNDYGVAEIVFAFGICIA